MRFAFEIDKLKLILRRTRTSDNSRQENSAEHSWHIALLALTLTEHANEPVDALRVAKMLLIHDIVEIDAGDTFGYDTAGHADKHDREVRAAERIFGLLPADQAAEFRALWDEFEASETPEAKFALSLDRLQAVMLNLATDGGSWKEHGVTYDHVIARNQAIAGGSKTLWEFAKRRIDEAAAKGHLPA
jgi:putative hydrolase of HD superfamily